MYEMWVRSLGREDPLEEGMERIHSSILVWRIPWTEEPGGLQSVGSQRVRHDRSDLTHREREKALEGRGVTTEMGTERVSGKGRVACQLEDTA